MKALRRIGVLLAAYAPSGALRRFIYRYGFGYTIAPDVRIGLGVVILVQSFTAERGVTIRRGTSFVGPISVHLGEGTFVGRWNRIECGDAAADPRQAHMNYARRFETGRNCLINESHLLDVLGLISIGDGSWLAGFASQFLTHGAGAMNRDIRIGENCFVGSAVRFAPGSGVGDRVMVAMGAVVTKRIPDNDVVVGGLPARVLKQREGEGDYTFQKTW